MNNFERGFSLVRPNRLCEKLVFADGIGSSGKGMLSHILASLQGVEKQSNHTPFDYIAYLHFLNKLSTDAAILYLQTEADQQLYHIMMSRDVNFRPKDSTGVLQNSKPLKYLSRLFSREGDDVVARIRREKPVLNEAPHDALRSASLFFDAFSDSLQIVYIIRDPFELILDWARRGFGRRIGSDPREFQFNVKRGSCVMPMFMLDYNFDETYGELNELERIVLMIRYGFKYNLLGYRKLDQKYQRNVLILHFDDLLREPVKTVERIGTFMHTQATRWTNLTLKRERVPRSVPNHRDMRGRIIRGCRPEFTLFIDQLEEYYENFCQLLSNFAKSEVGPRSLDSSLLQ